jgi:hypothetical protein
VIDYIGQITYFYAATASGLLLAPGFAANVTAHPTYGTITEEAHPWPALPALVNGMQFGPAFVLPIPAGTILVNTVGPVNINHAVFFLGMNNIY